ncbi:unnamed protein product [Sphagnum troendelagicum]|uniref:Formamidopyrimidine-DNA glycosylase catalytic domain-containing protein n=1 Tax=Sphagnum troendelagicum TaxID=128251 RepID=A0ABP0UP45_9BRYO
MPELPEVEAARRLVERHCIGAVISRAKVADDSTVISDVSPSKLQEALTGRRILGAHRKGKHLWLQLDAQPWPSFQFGMTGAVLIKGVKGPQYKSSKAKDDEEFPTKYFKVHLELDSGVEMAFTDKRRFARVRLLPEPSKAPPISELGFDALTELPSEEDFQSGIKSKKGSIKGLLLDQSFLAGIGNWVADEVLYQAKIHPEQPATILSTDDCKHLRAAIHEVVEKAVEVDADSERFPENWIFHQRWDRKPGKLDGKLLSVYTNCTLLWSFFCKGPTSAYVPALQKYSGPPLKSLRKKASSKDEADDEDEEAKVKSRKRVPDKRASAKDGRDDEDKEAQGNVQKRMSRKGVSSKKEPEDKVNEISESAQKRDSQRRASSKPQKREDEDEDSRKQSASKEDPEDRDNGPKVNTQKRASGNRAVSKEGQEDEENEEGKTKKRGRHNPTTATAQDKGSSAVSLGNAESKHGKGRPPKSINGDVSKATDVKPLTEEGAPERNKGKMATGPSCSQEYYFKSVMQSSCTRIDQQNGVQCNRFHLRPLLCKHRINLSTGMYRVIEHQACQPVFKSYVKALPQPKSPILSHITTYSAPLFFRSRVLSLFLRLPCA